MYSMLDAIISLRDQQLCTIESLDEVSLSVRVQAMGVN